MSNEDYTFEDVKMGFHQKKEKKLGLFEYFEKLIERTRMQCKRSLDTNKDETHRTTNRQKAVENIAFLKSLGVFVHTDQLNKTKLIIRKKEIA